MIAILDNIRSIHNVGSIFRTADAVGLEKIYLCGVTPAPLDRFSKVRAQFAKVSLGALKTVQWEQCASTARLISRLKKEGFVVCALEQSPKSAPYNRIPSRFSFEKIALMVGGEVRGLSPALLKKADHILEIPMHGKKESLNVSVAFGIAAFALREKRKN